MKFFRTHPVAAWVVIHLAVLGVAAVAAATVGDQVADHTSAYATKMNLYPIGASTVFLNSASPR
ncbi:MAG: hypothetical protein U5M53_05630 [Rhodoferax sp.]|nr:hypothetical protein [Rhodoferax sp.]